MGLSLAQKLNNRGAYVETQMQKIVAIRVKCQPKKDSDKTRFLTNKELKNLGVDPQNIGKITHHVDCIREGPLVIGKNESAFFSEVCSEWLYA